MEQLIDLADFGPTIEELPNPFSVVFGGQNSHQLKSYVANPRLEGRIIKLRVSYSSLRASLLTSWQKQNRDLFGEIFHVDLRMEEVSADVDHPSGTHQCRST